MPLFDYEDEIQELPTAKKHQHKPKVRRKLPLWLLSLLIGLAAGAIVWVIRGVGN